MGGDKVGLAALARRVAGLARIWMLAAAVTGGAGWSAPALAQGDLPVGTALAPFGPERQYPVQVQAIVPGSPASQFLSVGDVIVEIDQVTINTIDEMLFVLRAYPPRTVTIRRVADGALVQMPARVIYDPGRDTLWFDPAGPGATFTEAQPDINNVLQQAGHFRVPGATGLIQASEWRGEFGAIELTIDVETDRTCDPCRLRNIALMDLQTRAWLMPVPLTDVAAQVHPSELYRGRTVIAPSPVLARLPQDMHARGRVDQSFIGQALTGQYPSVFSPYTRPNYDYGMPDVRLAQMESRDRIVTDQAPRRQEFIRDRLGSLRVGELDDRRSYRGHFFFARPLSVSGPFLAVLDFGSGDFGVVRFEAAEAVPVLRRAGQGSEGPDIRAYVMQPSWQGRDARSR